MKNKQRFMVEILALLLTVISLVLGGLMYFSNQKNTKQNLIGVELADFIYNTNYSMQFGKKIETFYGMQENLQELRDSIGDVDELHILSADNQMLFSTDKDILPERVLSMPTGSNLSDRERLYCMYAINDDARILTVSGVDALQTELRTYLRALVLKAVIGFLVTWVLIRLVWMLATHKKKGGAKGQGADPEQNGEQDHKKAYRITAAVPLIWIVVFSAATGVDAYREYAGSTETLCDHIEDSVQTDIQRVEDLGVAREDFYEVEEYLERYTDLIPEVEQLTLGEDDAVLCKMSADYRRKMYLDYILQTVLLLTFSILILAEYQFFVTNTGTLAEEKENGTV